VEVGPEDRIIISASPIPGNEKSVYSMINELCRKGADVIYKGLAEVHVSGHACQEEIKMMIQLLRPKYMMPAHGEFRHLMIHAKLGRDCGVDPNNIFLSENGRVLEITAKGAKLAGTVPSGRVLVDGLGVGDVGTAVLRERMQLSDSGLILALATIDRQTGKVLAGPEVITRGFVFAKESGDLLAEMRTMTAGILEELAEKRGFDRTQARNKVRDGLSDYLYKKIKRSPVILPVFMEI
jgi:ribonuclease J